VCLKLYNLDISSTQFSACAELVFQFVEIFKQTIHFGCFHMPIGDIGSAFGSVVKIINPVFQYISSAVSNCLK